MPQTISQTYRRLADAQKERARGAPAYSAYVNRAFGRVLASLAFRAGLTANGATAVSAAHTATGLVLLIILPAQVWVGVAVACFLALGYAWDSADGQLARLRHGGSRAGEWLDHFVDATKLSSLHLVILVALWLHTAVHDSPWLLVPIVFSITSVSIFSGMLLKDFLRRSNGVDLPRQTGGGGLARSVLLLPTDFGATIFTVALWGVTPLFLATYTAGAIANIFFLLFSAIKWYREIRDMDRGSDDR